MTDDTTGEIFFQSNTCLLPMVDGEVSFCMELYGHYKKSVLWLGGGLADQPAFYMQLMRDIENLETTIKTHENH